jgi:hypothetical protein
MVSTRVMPMPGPRKSRRPPPDVATQLRHVDAAWHLLSGKYPPRNVAALYGIGKSELYRWKDWALSYDIPEAEALRRLYGHPSPAPSTPARIDRAGVDDDGD